MLQVLFAPPSLPLVSWLLPLFREQFVLSWRCPVPGLFHVQNQNLDLWSPLLCAVFVVLRFLTFIVRQGFSVDASSLPLALYVFSAVASRSCSAAAHLLRAEQAHYWLFFLDCVGVAIYQYGCALALFLYSSDPTWTQSMLGKIFLPAATVLTWFSCITCYCSKLHVRQPYLLIRKLCLVWMGGAISPVVHRLATFSWMNNATLLLHVLQVVLFLLSFFFFSCPDCFSPGRSHQLFHILLTFCMLVQQEALFQDFVWRRPVLARQFGEEWLLLACASFLCLTFCCAVMALAMRRRAQAELMKGDEGQR
ncbi:membrane progestin receptor beta-like [Echeneis naucrates]|uniref:membrane progestin receptor beta-like n=1 Tax=Echeneis naucrates TaxID=173247 RepID=UPI00111363CD|nr:membrane progestin receptor beta-like [Echeneis naucrates]